MAHLDPMNAVLATFTPWRLELVAARLHLRWGHRLLLVRLRSSDGLWLANHRRLEGAGGTAEMAICQVVRWCRGQTRRPLRWWEGAVSVGLGSEETLQRLREGGYDNGLATSCVLCGSREHPWDWWSLDGVVGPCCGWGRCREEAKA